MKKLPRSALVLACLFSFASLPASACEEGQCPHHGKHAMHHHHHAAEDAKMDKLSAEFLREMWRVQPEAALYAGKFDSAAVLPAPNQAERAKQVAFAQKWLAKLGKLNAQQLSPAKRSDLAMLQNQLQGDLWYYTTLKEYEWNPSLFNVASAFDSIANTEYAPKEQRLQSLLKRMQAVPAYYAAARASIRNPTPEHTRLAIEQAAGVQQVLKQSNLVAQQSKLSSAQKRQFDSSTKNALAAVQGYADWLGKVESGNDAVTAKRSFRIGKELYEAKFASQIQSGFSGEQTYQKALLAKEQMLEKMDKLADELWPKYMAGVDKPQQRSAKIGMVIDKLSLQHTTPEKFVEEVRQQLPALQKWVLEKNLLGTDASKPLQVRETPLYQRGVTTASIEAPGPFRSQDRTYYNVSPLTDMSPEQAESALREYNQWILQILNIHEAIPGHYTQLVYANKSPSLIKTLFGNGTMIEGWAVYGELMMMESGYGDNTPEMWLMYSKWNLRAICNTILDYSVHVLGMSREDALQLLMKDAFQSEAEATGKWRRVQLSSVQLASYYSGFAAIVALREERRKLLGEKFDLKQFHEQFLSYGSAPVPMIRELMMAGDAAPMMPHIQEKMAAGKAAKKAEKSTDKPTTAAHQH